MDKDEIRFEMHNLAAKRYSISRPLDMEKLYNTIFELRMEGCYMTGPVIIRKNYEEAFTDILLPLNRMPGEEREFKRCGTLVYNDCLYSREVIRGSTLTEISEKAENYISSVKEYNPIMIFALINVSGGVTVDSFIPVRSQDEQL